MRHHAAAAVVLFAWGLALSIAGWLALAAIALAGRRQSRNVA